MPERRSFVNNDSFLGRVSKLGPISVASCEFVGAGFLAMRCTSNVRFFYSQAMAIDEGCKNGNC